MWLVCPFLEAVVARPQLLGKRYVAALTVHCPPPSHQPHPQPALITVWSPMGTMTQPVSKAGQIVVVNVPHRQRRALLGFLVEKSHPTQITKLVSVFIKVFLQLLHFFVLDNL